MAPIPPRSYKAATGGQPGTLHRRPRESPLSQQRTRAPAVALAPPRPRPGPAPPRPVRLAPRLTPSDTEPQAIQSEASVLFEDRRIPLNLKSLSPLEFSELCARNQVLFPTWVCTSPSLCLSFFTLKR